MAICESSRKVNISAIFLLTCMVFKATLNLGQIDLGYHGLLSPNWGIVGS